MLSCLVYWASVVSDNTFSLFDVIALATHFFRRPYSVERLLRAIWVGRAASAAAAPSAMLPLVHRTRAPDCVVSAVKHIVYRLAHQIP